MAVAMSTVLADTACRNASPVSLEGSASALAARPNGVSNASKSGNVRNTASWRVGLGGLSRENMALMGAFLQETREPMSRRMFRLAGDQPLDGVHFAANERDIMNLDCCPSLARPCHLEVAGTETQHRAEEIRAVLLESKAVGIKALRTAADSTRLGDLPGRLAKRVEPPKTG